MKWYRGKRNNALRDDRGSTIIVVLVTMTFLTVLASILLYLSLVNLQMKKMDKAGKINFYSAEAVMNEIRAGVQDAVSDAIKDAYTSVLVSYNTTSKDEQTANFRSTFFTRLFTYAVGPTTLFPSATTYDPAALAAFVTPQYNGAVMNIDGSHVVEHVLDDSGNRLAVILKDVAVRYTKNGYDTIVSSDIMIKVPDLPYTSTSSRQTAIPDFAIVARGTLEQPAGNGIVSVFGNVYAGAVTVGGSGDTFNVQNAAYFISAGPVTVNGGTMSLNLNSSLWARDIRLDTGGSMNLAGDAYIANDLNLYGNQTQAVMSGRYYGYGDSVSNPNESSSIIINGKNTVLDMSALRALMLAGHSFVKFGPDIDGYVNSDVLMGESLSVKSNQLAYLVPEHCLKSGYSNPYQYTGAPPDNATLAGNAIDLNQQVNGKDLSEYGITSAADHIQYIHKSVGSTYLIYFCFKFPTSAAANTYFKDYYTANSAQVQKYLDLYSDGIILSSTATKNLDGEAFTFNEGVNKDDDAGDTDDLLGPLIDATNVPLASKEEIKNSYANLCVTLSRTESAAGIASAYDYFVNGNDIAAVPTGTSEYYPSEEAAKVVVTNGNYVMNAGSGSSIHIIIASGDVTVSGNYSGLILAGGSVTLQSEAVVTANRTAVADALQTLLAENAGVKYYRYLNPQYISPMNISTNSSGQTKVWDMNTLVIYENWTKNET